MNFRPIPTPPELFRQFEAGEMSREELHAAMAIHARGLIQEMEEDRGNPLTAYWERLRNISAARKWSQRIGRRQLREVLTAMGHLEGFPPAQILWNADHPGVPLHCFFRTKREPIFRIKKLSMEAMRVTLDIEFGKAAKDQIQREKLILRRNRRMIYELESRRPN